MARYPLLVSIGTILPAPTLGFSSFLQIWNLYLGRTLRSSSDAPSYILQARDHTRNISSSWPVIIYSVCLLPDPLHRVLQLCKASSNREQLLSDMPKQHKRWQRIHRMPEIQLPTCITLHQWSNMTVWWSRTFKKRKGNNRNNILKGERR